MQQQQNQNQQQNQPPQQIYLFVSKNCRHCPDLIKEIQKKPELAKKIQAVGVENVSSLPPGLTRVPGLLVEGKVIMGNDCFKWVNEYGEIGAGPSFHSSSGFQVDSFSFIESGASQGPTGTNTYSFIGENQGSEGINTKVIDMEHQKEQQRRTNSSDSIMKSMEALEQQRRQEMATSVGNQRNGGRGPHTQTVY